MIETFTLTRREQISGVDAKAAKPLSAEQRKQFASQLTANHHVIIDGRIRNLATEIVGNEKNPVLDARRLYNWELANSVLSPDCSHPSILPPRWGHRRTLRPTASRCRNSGWGFVGSVALWAGLA